MKSLIAGLVTMLSASMALAISPCNSIKLKRVNCEITDAAHGTSASITIYRDVTSGGSRPYCTTGVIQEGILGNISFATKDYTDLSDFLVSKAKDSDKEMTALEAGQPVTVAFYSGGLMIDDLAAKFTATPDANGAITGKLTLSGKAINIYARHGDEAVILDGEALCTEQKLP